jgi:glutathione S-transferase
MTPPRLNLLIGSRNFSSWSLRPWLALRLSGLAFETTLFDLYGPGRAEIPAHSPNGKVPCLVVQRDGVRRDGRLDLKIWDSLAICEYVAELAPSAQLWPADPDTRAWARSITAEMHSGFADLRQTCPMDIRARHSHHDITPETARQIARIKTIWTQCREASHDKGAFLFGPFGIADCFYAPVVTRFHTYGVALDGPAGDYMQAVRDWAAMREWSAEGLKEEERRTA